MAAATAVTPIDRPRGNIQQFSFSITPGAIGAAGTEVETIAVPGANVGDCVKINASAAGFQDGIIIYGERVSAAGVVTFKLGNFTAGSITPTASTLLTLTLIRGTTMVFAR